MAIEAKKYIYRDISRRARRVRGFMWAGLLGSAGGIVAVG